MSLGDIELAVCQSLTRCLSPKGVAGRLGIDQLAAAAQLHLLPVFGARPFPASLITSDTSMRAALQPVKLIQRIYKRGCDVGGRFAVQPLDLD